MEDLLRFADSRWSNTQNQRSDGIEQRVELLQSLAFTCRRADSDSTILRELLVSSATPDWLSAELSFP
jgi:hypothetical protein